MLSEEPDGPDEPDSPQTYETVGSRLHVSASVLRLTLGLTLGLAQAPPSASLLPLATPLALVKIAYATRFANPARVSRRAVFAAEARRTL